LTHTNRDIRLLEHGGYFDDEVGMFRANKTLVTTDLHCVGKNRDMLEELEDVGADSSKRITHE